MSTTTTALEAALNTAAPDQERWIAGQNAYSESQQTDPGNDEKAYYAALDAAAPDEDSWIAGRNALVLNNALLLPPIDRAKIRLGALKNKKSDKRWSAQAGPVFAVRMLIFGIGVFIFLMLRPIVAVTYDSSYGDGAGIAAALVLFLFIALASFVVGEVIISKARKQSTPPTPAS